MGQYRQQILEPFRKAICNSVGVDIMTASSDPILDTEKTFFHCIQTNIVKTDIIVLFD